MSRKSYRGSSRAKGKQARSPTKGKTVRSSTKGKKVRFSKKGIAKRGSPLKARLQEILNNPLPGEGKFKTKADWLKHGLTTGYGITY